MKHVLQSGFYPRPNVTPGTDQFSLKLGRVQKVNAGAKTIDIVLLDGSGMLFDVPVVGPAASTMSGTSYLPDPHLKDDDDYSMYGDEKRDLYAIIGFANGVGKLPVCIGFRHPNQHQLSFDNGTGFENHYLDRHAGDRYHRIVGDTVAEMGGNDAPTEEEVYWPDGSYFKVYHSSPALTELTGQNVDDENQPFRLKSETTKGFYFQHASGAIVKIDATGDIQIKHPSGSWFSLAASTSAPTAQTLPNTVIDSVNNPPTTASPSAIQIHIKHSSGTTINIDASGNISISGGGTLGIHSDGAMTVSSDSTVTVQATSAIQLNAPSVTKNGSEIDTV